MTARPDTPLTPRETECVKLLADGHSMDSAAHVIKIKTRTVRFHLANAKVRMGANTLSHLVAKVLTQEARQ